MTKQIPLTQGKVALVDDADYEWLSQWTWHYRQKERTGYAVRTSLRSEAFPRVEIRMHRAIMDAKDGEEVDHQDNNGLNNQRANLRICTRAQNMGNQRLKVGSASGYKGVTWFKTTSRWRASIMIQGRAKYLGYFHDKDEAARAYNAAALEYFGEFARLNDVDARA